MTIPLHYIKLRFVDAMTHLTIKNRIIFKKPGQRLHVPNILQPSPLLIWFKIQHASPVFDLSQNTVLLYPVNN